MNHVLSGWLLGLMALGMVWSLILIADSDHGPEESHFRLLALVMGLPMALLLTLEGLLSAWTTATVVVGIVAFALGRPWRWFGWD